MAENNDKKVNDILLNGAILGLGGGLLIYSGYKTYESNKKKGLPVSSNQFIGTLEGTAEVLKYVHEHINIDGLLNNINALSTFLRSTGISTVKTDINSSNATNDKNATSESSQT